MFRYQTMTKGCYMPNINAFRPVVHKEEIFKGFYYINLYKIFPFRALPFVTQGTLFEET